MARWLPAVATAASLCAACLFPSLGPLADGTGPDAGVDAAAVDAAVDAQAGDALRPDSGSTDFFDDFNRADGPSIGNAWITKKPSSYELSGGAVRWLGGDALSYRDHVVYRPPAEDRRDVKVQMNVFFDASDPSPAYPQIHLRIQGATAAVPDTLDSYLLFVNDDPAVAILARQRGTAYVTALATLTISPQLDAGKSYRLSLSAFGANPVNLTASIEARDTNNQWMVVVTKSVSDADPQRIDTAGAVGFSGGDGAAGVHVYDDFSATAP